MGDSLIQVCSGCQVEITLQVSVFHLTMVFVPGIDQQYDEL